MNITNEKIIEMFKDPKFGLVPSQQFARRLKEQGYKVKIKDVEALLKSREVSQMFKRTKKMPFFKIVARPRSFQIDIMYVKDLKNKNKGHDKIFIMVDILSRKAFGFPLKTRTFEEILPKFKRLLDSIGRINSISGDDEFNKKSFTDYLKSKDISYNFTVANDEHITSGDSLGTVDRFVRTFRNLILKYLYETETTNWIDHIEELFETYNNTKSAVLEGRTRNEAWEDFVFKQRLLKEGIEHNNDVKLKILDKFSIGDYVRVVLEKNKFDKERPPFSRTIYKIKDMEGYRFVVENNGTELKRRYKPNELQKVSPSEIPDEPKPHKVTQAIREGRRENKGEAERRKEGIDEQNILKEKRKPKKKILE